MATSRSRRGATSIEYALIGSLVSISIILALTNMGSKLSMFYDIVAALVSAAI